ncbi:hypothetical protein V5O48_009429 [Marasmius crinis-equi]|uniref:Glucose-methanol-choline oxidoreductase N-terminal domain-containing protein n=1 Tax=Marasmius crinis-equi TaxID=585013 RepID=A0ABR3FBS2_9AGAR
MWRSLLTTFAPIVLIKVVVGYDYVIVGGGTGGLTVASRLAEDPGIEVLVLEAGPNAEHLPEVSVLSPFAALSVFIPGLIGTGQSYTTLNWAYNTTPQENLNNRILNVKAGKALGGSTVINSMIFPRGQKDQYDAWGTLNNDSSWTWNALLPYFKRSEIFTPPNKFQAANGAQFLPQFHGFNSEKGRVHVGFPNFFFPQAELWAQTAVGMGFAATPDLTSGEVEAVGVSPNSLDAANNTRYTWFFRFVGKQYAQSRRVRCSAACAYFTPFADRPNFTVITNVTVSRIIWSTKKDNSMNLVASGVEYYSTDITEPHIANVSREVIVSAGTVGSPKVLELSGVGNNTITTDVFSQNPDLAQQQLDLWFENRTGLYSSASGRTLAITPPSKIFSSSELDTLVAEAHANLSHFAAQFSNGNPNLAKGIKAQHKLALKLYLDDKAGPLEMNLTPGYGGLTPQEQRLGENFTTIIVVLYAPLSRGRIHIASSDPRIPPFVDPAYWSHPLDVAANVAGIKLARKMLASRPLSSTNLGEFEPGFDIQSDEEIEGWLKDIAGGDNHPVGTMAMLPRELGGVVDTSLKIYGTENVRVADASIIPFPISAHISSTVYMIGEKPELSCGRLSPLSSLASVILIKPALGYDFVIVLEVLSKPKSDSSKEVPTSMSSYSKQVRTRRTYQRSS